MRVRLARKTTLAMTALLGAALVAGCSARAVTNGPTNPGAAGMPGAGDHLVTTDLRKLQPLPETEVIKPTGQTKQFDLVLKEGAWDLVKGVTTPAITINGKVPGPVLKAVEGDLVKIAVKNELKQPTSIHLHGMHLPNNMDGVPPYTQQEIQPGATFTYEFPAGHAGTYMYHSHAHGKSVEQIDKGLYGAFVIEPQNLSNQPKFDRDYTLVLGGWNVMEGGMGGMGDMGGTGESTGGGGAHNMDNMGYNYWTINGKSFPDTEKLTVKKGERVRVRLVNVSNAAHPMHLHGQDFRVIAEDGHPVKDPQVQNTVDVAPGRIVDIEFLANNPGAWVFHCHELHHTMNGEVEPGGLITLVEYEGYAAPAGDAAAAPAQAPAKPAPSNPHANMPGM